MGESSGWDGVRAGLVVRISFLVFRLLFLFFFFFTHACVRSLFCQISPLPDALLLEIYASTVNHPTYI